MRIRGARVYTKDHRFEEKLILTRNGRIAEEGEEKGKSDDKVLDGTGCIAIPGLVDLHFHGAMGADVCDGTREAYQKIAAYEASCGITAICPATLTLPVEHLEKVLSEGAAFRKDEKSGKEPASMADLVGFNMEGPFISYEKKGAQNPIYIKKADPVLVDRFLKASDGLVKIVGLAPEQNPDFEAYIRAVKDRITVSLAHTNADYDTAMAAFAAGAHHAVHLYNAMTGLSHRAPGVVGAVMDSEGVTAEIICDGIHVHPAAVRAAFQMNGADRMVLISDSLRSTGMPDGGYDLGGQKTEKHGRLCTLVEGGSIAGSVTNLMDCMRYAVHHMGIPLETAIACASENPAKVLHIDNEYGSLAPGYRADIVLLREGTLETVAVIKDGIRIA